MGRRVTFLEAARGRVLLFDGAMGTEIQALDPGPEDFPDGKEGFNDGLVLSRPEWISKIHRSYIEAGADCIETNSFGSNKIKLDEYGFGERTVEINEKAASLAAAEAGRVERDVYVVGSMGPTGYLPSSNDPDLGQIPLDTIQDAFALQAEGLVRGGADALIIETSQDILEVKLAIEGAHAAMEKSGSSVPLIANTTLDRYGKMLLGTTVQAAYTTVSDMGIDFFGLNCSTGPREMAPSVRWLSGQGHGLLVVPNAGMPENDGGRSVYGMTPDDMAGVLGGFISEYPQVRMVGGCCGTTPAHISALRRAIDGAQAGGR
ncbi:methionine synthase I (cobalamin-dependent), methyltransferase domain [Cenarchaeum symbiosum A]|uniref:methionine synthase n=1 Tax=Cenarchaeum symbiosum (strain A) TaxID=414004 RepID=A0RW49_CENSY|nr:methionine synthase I (cobalamin-dependent), methyltransferase domain [Cenarchaeum symbiosum A]